MNKKVHLSLSPKRLFDMKIIRYHKIFANKR